MKLTNTNELPEKAYVSHGKITHPIDDPCKVCDEAKREWKIVKDLLDDQKAAWKAELLKKLEEMKFLDRQRSEKEYDYHFVKAYNQALDDIIKLIKE